MGNYDATAGDFLSQPEGCMGAELISNRPSPVNTRYKAIPLLITWDLRELIVQNFTRSQTP